MTTLAEIYADWPAWVIPVTDEEEALIPPPDFDPPKSTPPAAPHWVHVTDDWARCTRAIMDELGIAHGEAQTRAWAAMQQVTIRDANKIRRKQDIYRSLQCRRVFDSVTDSIEGYHINLDTGEHSSEPFDPAKRTGVEDVAVSPEDQLVAQEETAERERFRQILPLLFEELSGTYADVLRMRNLEGKSFDEIGRALIPSVRKSTAHRMYEKALARAREILTGRA